MDRAKLTHYLAGIEGLALLRHWLVGDRKQAERRFVALRALVSEPQGQEIEFQAPELGVVDGYAKWAATYDLGPNPLIALEQDVVRGLIDRIPIGRALDAACGSGRHTAYLVERGHDVSGVDASEDMLVQARGRLPHTDLRRGDLASLPIESSSIDLALCTLALTHCTELAAPLTELARVLRPGGRLIVSDLHPFMLLLGNTALFIGSDGRPGIVKSHPHSHADYQSAFAIAGLRVVRCIEPVYTEAQLPALVGPLPASAREAIASALLGLPGAIVWELTAA